MQLYVRALSCVHRGSCSLLSHYAGLSKTRNGTRVGGYTQFLEQTDTKYTGGCRLLSLRNAKKLVS